LYINFKFFYNVSKPTGGKIGEKCLINSFIYNKYAYSIYEIYCVGLDVFLIFIKKEKIMRILKLLRF
jgi:hypothetical protein